MRLVKKGKTAFDALYSTSRKSYGKLYVVKIDGLNFWKFEPSKYSPLYPSTAFNPLSCLVQAGLNPNIVKNALKELLYCG